MEKFVHNPLVFFFLSSTASKLMSLSALPTKTIHLLEYFVGCCSIFNYLNDKLQNDSFNQLPNAVSFYFTLKEF